MAVESGPREAWDPSSPKAHVCDEKMFGSFFSIPKDDVLKGTFELDKELNYVVIANSKRLFAKITSFFESGFTSSPDVKLRGNLFDFFQD